MQPAEPATNVLRDAEVFWDAEVFENVKVLMGVETKAGITSYEFCLILDGVMRYKKTYSESFTVDKACKKEAEWLGRGMNRKGVSEYDLRNGEMLVCSRIARITPIPEEGVRAFRETLDNLLKGEEPGVIVENEG